MTNALRLIAAATAAGLSGCFSFDSNVSVQTGEEHVLVSNFGWRLFNCIPIACGNATDPAGGKRFGPWAFFRDDVTMDKIQKRLADYAATRPEKELTSLAYHNYDTLFVSIPYTEVPIPIPYIVTYREIQLSGVMK